MFQDNTKLKATMLDPQQWVEMSAFIRSAGKWQTVASDC